MIKRFFAFFLMLALSAGFISPTAPARAADVTVYAAASLKDVLDAVNGAFTNQTGLSVAASYGASSTLARQIDNGAPADVFISADTDWMDNLAAKNLLIVATRHNLLGNSLVMVAPKDSAKPLALTDKSALTMRLGDGRLAMGLVESVPAGKYGKAALEALGLWEGVKAKLAEVDNVRVALTLVARGEAPLGIVYGSDAAVEPRVAVVAEFPESSHPPIIYPVAAIASSASSKTLDKATSAYLSFLQNATAQKLFTNAGFTLLPAS